MERRQAALSNACLAQNEIMNLTLRNIIDWISRPHVTVTTAINADYIYNKLEE